MNEIPNFREAYERVLRDLMTVPVGGSIHVKGTAGYYRIFISEVEFIPNSYTLPEGTYIP